VALEAKVLTVSDSSHAGRSTDEAGPALEDRLVGAGFAVRERRVAPDGVESVANAVRELCEGFTGLVVTTGGTGFAPRDLTPEGTALVLDRHAPGIAEAMRAADPRGRLTRGLAGTRGSALIVNLPGSPSGAVDSLEAVLEVIPHALELLAGGEPHRHG